ncbi:exosortase/archaeosortase family protein [Kitasatospora aureofaciens]|uniref:exosortase/archaeosortase family protein n=1 Tax=Kitasatospora aureofaciens TaxID=1894 RepID=UPI001C47812A|nr:exosortase/archaeosortase family protein [Kitasatospora aureofaciens]MBV6696107.1 exosortase/archaeosortase family protein [Kitasatospora aureofaciens]
MAEAVNPAGTLGTGAGSRAGAVRSLRLCLSGALLIGALLLMVHNDRFRSLEAVAAGPLVHLVTASPVAVDPRFAIVFFDVHSLRMEGLRITSECTAALVIAPIAALAGVLVGFVRFRVGRVLTALGVSALILFAVNQLRLLLIAFATHTWGLKHGYGWSHLLVGSLMTSVGAMLSIAAFFLLVSRTGRGRGSAPADGGTAP